MKTLLSKMFLILFMMIIMSHCENSSDFLSVVGEDQIFLKPDLINLHFSIKSLEKKSTISLESNTKKHSKVIQSIKNLGISLQELSTTDFNISPRYQYQYDVKTQRDIRIFDGYETTCSIHIQTKKLDLIGNIIDEAIKNGADQIDRVNFSISESIIAEYKELLMIQALENGKQKALKTLKPLGYNIKGIKRIDIPSFDDTRIPYQYRRNNKRSFMAYSESSSPQILSKEEKISIRIPIEFYIEKSK